MSITMQKYILIHFSVNQVPATPVCIGINDLNAGAFSAKKISEVPALLAFLNYTFFNYEAFEHAEYDDAQDLLEQHNGRFSLNCWDISDSSFTFNKITELAKEDVAVFRKYPFIQFLDNSVNPLIYLTPERGNALSAVDTELDHHLHVEMISQFNKIAFDLTKTKALSGDLTIFRNLIEGYQFDNFNTLDSIDCDYQDGNTRDYMGHSLDIGYPKKDYEISFSLYKDRKDGERNCTIHPMTIELLLNGSPIDENLSNLAKEHWGYELNLILTDLYRNTFEPHQINP